MYVECIISILWVAGRARVCVESQESRSEQSVSWLSVCWVADRAGQKRVCVGSWSSGGWVTDRAGVGCNQSRIWNWIWNWVASRAGFGIGSQAEQDLDLIITILGTLGRRQSRNVGSQAEKEQAIGRELG